MRIKNKLYLVFLFFGSVIMAQKESGNVEMFKQNEISLNVMYLLIFPAVEINYERILDSTNSFGVNLFLNLEDDNYDVPKFSIGSYYRMYFLNTKEYGSQGFFVHGEFSYTEFEDNDDYYNSYQKQDELETNSFSVGASLGWKWISKKNVTAEVLLGVERFFNDQIDYGGGIAPVFSLAIGKRF